MTKTLNCRSCMADVFEFTSYSVNHNAFDDVTLKEIFESELGYQILPEQPQQFCDSCQNILTEWHKFKLVCHKTQDLYGAETVWFVEKGDVDIKTEPLMELDEINDSEPESEAMDYDDDGQNEEVPNEELQKEQIPSVDLIKVPFRMFIRNYGQQLAKNLTEVGLVTVKGSTLKEIMHEIWLLVKSHIKREIVFEDNNSAPKWHKDKIVQERHLSKFILFKDTTAKRTYDTPNLNRFKSWSDAGNTKILFIYPYSKSIQTLLHWKLANAALIDPDDYELMGLMRQYKYIQKGGKSVVTIKAYIRYYPSQKLTENFVGNFTIAALDFRTFSNNLWQIVRGHIKKEIIFYENAVPTLSETSPKESDLKNFVTFFDVTGRRTYDLESITDQVLHSWTQKEIVMTIYPYSTSVETKFLFKSAKNIIDLPNDEKKIDEKPENLPVHDHLKMTLKAQIRYYKKQKNNENPLDSFKIAAPDFRTFSHNLWETICEHIQKEIISNENGEPILSANSPIESDLSKFVTFFDISGRRTYNLDYLESLSEEAFVTWTEKEILVTIYPYSTSMENRAMFLSAKNLIDIPTVKRKIVTDLTKSIKVTPMPNQCQFICNSYILENLKQIHGKKYPNIKDAFWKMWSAYVDCYALIYQEKLMNENPPTQLMPFFKPDFYDIPSVSSESTRYTVKFLARLKQAKSDQNFLFLGDLTVQGETLEDILDRIWELIHKYLIREVIFNGDDFKSWHPMEKPTRECIRRFITINDPKRKVLFKLPENDSSSYLVERWSISPILLLNIFPFSTSVSCSERLKSLKKYLKINESTQIVIDNLKDRHNAFYVAFDWSWRMWAHYVQGHENESLLEEEPPSELKHLFLNVPLQYTYQDIFDGRKNQIRDGSPTVFAKKVYDSLNIQKKDSKKENKLLKCPYSGCESVIKSSTLRRHLIYCQYNPYLDKKYPCRFEGCKRSFPIKFMLNNHQKVCRLNPNREVPKMRQCPQCPARVTNLNLHIFAKHTDAKVVCDICGETKSTKYMLRDHIKSVHLQIKYQCDKCSTEYKRKDALERHIIREHSTLPFKVDIKCDSCSYRTNRRENISRHIRLHHNPNPKPIDCDKCGKSFICERSLKSHMAVHEHTKFACNICNHVCTTKRGLECHMTLHQEKKYECPVCFMKIRSSNEVRMHLKRKHPDYELPPKGMILKKTSKRRGKIPGLS